MAERNILVDGGVDNARTLASGDTPALLTRTIFNRYANATTTTTSQESLWSNSIAANTFISDGGMLEFWYVGKFASNTRLKAFEVTFGSTSIFNSNSFDDISISGASGAGWQIHGQIIRASSSEVRYFTQLTARGLTAPETWTKANEITGLDLAATAYNLVLKATTEDVAGDLTAKFAKCIYHPGV